MSETKKFSIDSILMTTVILFTICTLIAAALAGTNAMTAGKIAELNTKNKNDSMAEVLPADDYTATTVTLDGKEETAYLAKQSGQTAGYVVTATDKGYGGDIEVMVGVKPDGSINAVKILAADDETPGLGKKVTEKSRCDLFAGKTADNCELEPITSATFSSTGVNRAVKHALAIADAAEKQEKAGDNNG